MLLRVLPGLPNNGRCTDDEQITRDILVSAASFCVCRRTIKSLAKGPKQGVEPANWIRLVGAEIRRLSRAMNSWTPARSAARK
jgi:hypothetical protein